MSQVNHPVQEIARKTLARVLQAWDSMQGSQLADALSTSDSTVSRMKSGEIERCIKTLLVLGFKVVPQTHRCVDRQKYAQLCEWAEIGIQAEKRKMMSEPQSTELEWEQDIY